VTRPVLRIDRRFLNWGVFFIVLGAVPLAVSGGVVDPGTTDRAWTLWPILLMAGGAGILLRETPLAFVGGLIAAITFGLIGGGILASGNFPVAGCGDAGETVAFEPWSGRFDPAASVEVELNCGNLTVDTAAGSEWELTGTAPDGAPPVVDATSEGLRVRGPERTAPLGLLSSGQQWTLALPTEPTLVLDVGLNAGDATLDLADARLELLVLELNAGRVRADLSAVAALDEIELSVNAGSAGLTLPDRSLTGSVELNAGQVRICTTGGTAIRIVADGAFAATLDLPGLTRTDDVYESPGFAGAATRIELRVGANAGQVTLNPGGGCDA
jgi:hypothetical protein